MYNTSVHTYFLVSISDRKTVWKGEMLLWLVEAHRGLLGRPFPVQKKIRLRSWGIGYVRSVPNRSLVFYKKGKFYFLSIFLNLDTLFLARFCLEFRLQIILARIKCCRCGVYEIGGLALGWCRGGRCSGSWEWWWRCRRREWDRWQNIHLIRKPTETPFFCLISSALCKD